MPVVKRKKRLQRRRLRRARAIERGDVQVLPDTHLERPLAVRRPRAVSLSPASFSVAGFGVERSGIRSTLSRQEAELWGGDNVNRTEKALILSEPRPGVRNARWRAYVARAAAKDAELEGDWEGLATAIAEAWAWDEQAKVWDAVEVAVVSPPREATFDGWRNW
jgi:hypothetical protein